MLKRVTCKGWIKAALVRAVRTVAQSAVAAIGSATLMGGVKWTVVLSTAALAGVLSLLTSLTGLPECGGKGEKNAEAADGNIKNGDTE